MVQITHVNLLNLATNIQYGAHLEAIANASTSQISFLSFDTSFLTDILGANPTQELVASTSWEAFHEAGVYNIETGMLYATSNFAGSLDNPINVTAIDIHNNNQITSVRYPHLAEANGGAAFYPVGTPVNSSAGQQIVFCDEGDLVHPSQLTLVDPSTGDSRVLVNSFLGRNFSSLNDVEQHPYVSPAVPYPIRRAKTPANEHRLQTGDLWFTDARYGYWQYFRPEPVIRPQVYRFEPNTGIIQAVADDFIAPNGIEFSPDYKYVYVTDTGAHTFPNKDNLTDPSTIYRFDITCDGKRLANRQLFAYVQNGFPDGIHTDTKGNVYSACADGIHVWSPSGVLLGIMAVGNGGSNNFAFVPGGMYIFNGYQAFRVGIQAVGRTVMRDFGLS